MKNTRKNTKLLIFVLAVLMLASLLAVSAFADHDDAYNLISDGTSKIDFSDFDSTNDNANAYLYEKMGMFFTLQNKIDPSANVTVADIDAGEGVNNALVVSNVAFVNGSTKTDVVNEGKYGMNKDILDLFFSAQGPAKFTMTYDIIISSALPATTQDGAKYDASLYRGISVISIGQYNYFFKATTAGIGAYEDTGEKITYNKVEYPVYKATTGDENKGWLYSPDMLETVVATENNGLAVDYSAGLNHSISGAISKASMEEGGGALQYTVGKPFTVKTEFTRGATETTVKVYIDLGDGNGFVEFYNGSISHEDIDKAFGIRFMDSGTTDFSVAFDNFVLTVDENCGTNHGGFGSFERLVRNAGGYIIEKYCSICNTVYEAGETYHPGESFFNPYIQTSSDVKDGNFQIAATVILDKEHVNKTSSPYRISFDMNVKSLFTDTMLNVTSSETLKVGRCLLGWNMTGVSSTEATHKGLNGYANILRMWLIPDGNGGYLSDRVILRTDSSSTSNYVCTLQTGEKYSFDIFMDPATGKFDVYVNGAYVTTYTNTAAIWPDDELITDWRFRFFEGDFGDVDVSNFKLVKTGDFPSNHVIDHNGATLVLGDGYLKMVGECLICGKMADEITSTDLYDASLNTSSSSIVVDDNRSFIIQNVSAKYLNSTEKVMGAYAAPFWISFKVNTDFDINTMKGKNDKLTGKGYSFINFGDNYSKMPFRLFLVDENGDLVTTADAVDTTKVAFKNAADRTAETKGYFNDGGTYDISLYCIPRTNQVRIYIGGEYVTTAESALDLDGKSGVYDVRFLEQNWGTFKFENFIFANTAAVDHICSDEWSDGIKKVIQTDDTLAYTFLCSLCGEEFTEQINGVVENNVASVYGKGTQSYTAPEGKYWIASDIRLEDGATGALIALGNTEILNTTDLGDAKKADVAIYVDGNSYVLCVNGAEIKHGEWTGETVITYGNDALTNTIFIYNKLVTTGATTSPVVPEVNGCDHIESDDTDILCERCGEIAVRDNPNVIKDVVSSVQTNNGSTAYSLTHTEVGEIFSMDKIWVSFDLEVNGIPDALSSGGKSLLTWFKSMPDVGSSDENIYAQWFRIYPVKDSEQAIIPTQAQIRLKRYYKDDNGSLEQGYIEITGSNFVLNENQKYAFDIRMNLDSGEYDVYINGVYYASERAVMDFDKLHDYGTTYLDRKYLLRLGDSQTGVFTWENVKITAEHKHSIGNGAETLRYDTAKIGGELAFVYTCSVCGNEVASRGSVALANKIPVIYDGYEKVSITAPDGRYVISTDINIRENASGSLLTLGGVSVLDVPADVAVPTTLSTVVIVDGNSFKTYIDGTLANEGTLTETVENVTFGAASYGAHIRFSNNRIATLEVTHNPVGINSPVDSNVKVCYHTEPMGENANKAIYYGTDGSLNVTYVCTDCGERVYTTVTESIQEGTVEFDKNGNAVSKFPAANEFTLTKGIGEPYWLSFDVTLKEFATPDVNENTDLTNKRIYKGYGLVTVQPYGGIYASQLRVFADGWEPNKSEEDACDFDNLTAGTLDEAQDVYTCNGDYRTATYVTSLEKNVKTNFALYIDPNTGDYDVYVNGKYKVSANTPAYEMNYNPQIRLGENGAGRYLYENFKLVKESEVYNDNVTVIETEAKFTATATEAGTYEPLVTLDRTDAEGAKKSLDLIYVDAFTGQLAYKVKEAVVIADDETTADIDESQNSTPAEYVALVNEAGAPIVLTDTKIPFTFVYDDIKGTVRYFINGKLPFKAVEAVAEGDPTTAVVGEIAVYDSTFKTTLSVSDNISVRVYNPHTFNSDNTIKSCPTYPNVTVNSVYTLNGTGVPEVLGYQENDINNRIRFIAGVDTDYYTEIGFDLVVKNAEGVDVTNSAKPETVGNNIFYAVEADDKYLFADKYGYTYFSAIAIKEIANAIDYTIEVTPYTMIGDGKLSGTTAIVKITSDGYQFVQ